MPKDSNTRATLKRLWIIYAVLALIFIWYYLPSSQGDESINVPEYLKQHPNVNLEPFKYDNEKNSWIQGDYSSQEGILKKELHFVTYNIFRKRIYPRIEALFSIVGQLNADVIAFQEVTKDSLAILLKEEWLRKSYWISDVNGSTFKRDGVVIFSKIPYNSLRIQEIPSNQNRRALIVEFLINGENFRVASSHLDPLSDDSSLRAKQFKVVSYLLSLNNQHGVFMGDFNFVDEEEYKQKLAHSSFNDVWVTLKGNEPGYTYDPTLNKFAAPDQYSRRIDLVLYFSYSLKWKSSSIKLLGTEQLLSLTADDGEPLFPSSHFGIYAVLEYK